MNLPSVVSALKMSLVTIIVCKGTIKRGQYKTKKHFFLILLSSVSTFDEVKGTIKRGQYKTKKHFFLIFVSAFLYENS